jgi:hypothetical protein
MHTRTHFTPLIIFISGDKTIGSAETEISRMVAKRKAEMREKAAERAAAAASEVAAATVAASRAAAASSSSSSTSTTTTTSSSSSVPLLAAAPRHARLGSVIYNTQRTGWTEHGWYRTPVNINYTHSTPSLLLISHINYTHSTPSLLLILHVNNTHFTSAARAAHDVDSKAARARTSTWVAPTPPTPGVPLSVTLLSTGVTVAAGCKSGSDGNDDCKNDDGVDCGVASSSTDDATVYAAANAASAFALVRSDCSCDVHLYVLSCVAFDVVRLLL